MNSQKNIIQSRERRKKRVRARITGQSDWLRLNVFRSNKYIYAQIIDDKKRVTLLAKNDVKALTKDKMTKTQKARQVGLELGKSLLKLNIKQVVFDRGFYNYGGRVRALAGAVREAGVTI